MLPTVESASRARNGCGRTGPNPAGPGYFHRPTCKDKECRAREWGAGLRGGGFGAVLPRFGAFWAIFPRFWQKAKDPLPRELNPRLPPYFAGGVTKIPGPWSCCRETGPEPPGSGFGGIIRSSFLSGSGFGPAGSQVWPLLGDRPPLPYPRACKSGAYPRKKAGSAGIGLRPGPRSGKASRRPATRLERPD